MTQLIMTIAMLCNVKPIKVMSPEQVDQYQLTCQQEYLRCIRGKSNLTKCVLTRTIKGGKK